MDPNERVLGRVEASVRKLRSRTNTARTSDLVVPNLDEFVYSDRYLALSRPSAAQPYPRQMTFLKLVFLQTELLTEYDFEVIGEWSERFRRGDENGIQPDVLERVEICKQRGYPWFHEVLPILGRRGGKNFLGSIAGAYVLWHHLAIGDPQAALGLEPDATLTFMVVASKYEQARDAQWRALTDRILGAPYFKPYVQRPGADTLRVFSPSDLERRRHDPSYDPRRAAFQITAEETSPSGVRGMASVMTYFDEMAHGASPGTLASVEELYEAAKPSLDQTGSAAMIWETSTPSYQRGQFWENYLRSFARDDAGPVEPAMLMAQLKSWDPYEDWDRATSIPRHPGGPTFTAFTKAVISYDERMQTENRRNPLRFAVEREAHFGVSGHAYLNADRVRQIFEPLGDRHLAPNLYREPAFIYYVHVDPSHVRANTAVAVGHAEIIDGELHVVFDQNKHFEPEGQHHEIDYKAVRRYLFEILDKFRPEVITFDKPAPIELVQDLREHAGQMGYRTVIVVQQTNAGRNWAVCENFSEAINRGLVHSPYDQLALDELLNLEVIGKRVDHPETGSVTTKDKADAMMEVVYWLMDRNNRVAQRLADLRLGMTLSGSPTRGGSPGIFQQQLSEFGRWRRPPRGPERGGRFT